MNSKFKGTQKKFLKGNKKSAKRLVALVVCCHVVLFVPVFLPLQNSDLCGYVWLIVFEKKNQSLFCLFRYIKISDGSNLEEKMHLIHESIWTDLFISAIFILKYKYSNISLTISVIHWFFWNGSEDLLNITTQNNIIYMFLCISIDQLQ